MGYLIYFGFGFALYLYIRHTAEWKRVVKVDTKDSEFSTGMNAIFDFCLLIVTVGYSPAVMLIYYLYHDERKNKSCPNK